MKCLVIGYGSIGSRHARLLSAMGHEVHIVSKQNNLPFPRYSDLSLTGKQYFDMAVVATPTAKHADDYKRLAPEAVGRVLIEKPVLMTLSQYPDILSHPLADRTWVGFNLRFHPGVCRLRAELTEKTVYSMLLYAGQYLPDWRPGSDYSKSYSASKQKGGGVLRDLSHELDLACLLAGPWRSVTGIGQHASHLTIDSEDVFSLLSRHTRCSNVAISLNYLDRHKQRFILAHYESGTACLDLIRNRLNLGSSQEFFDLDQDATYVKQLENILSDEPDTACTLAEAIEAQSMLNATEVASEKQQWVHR